MLIHGLLAIVTITAILKLAITRIMKKRNILGFPLINSVQKRIYYMGDKVQPLDALSPDNSEKTFLLNRLH